MIEYRGWWMWILAAVLLVLTVAGAIAQWRAEHEAVAWIALAQTPIYIAAVWLVVMQRTASRGVRHSLVGILLVGVAMRLVIIAAPPVSSDIYRYIWDGRVQAVGINPYRYVPADEALRGLRDEAIYPNINRAEYAPTIYPPAAQIVFLAVTRVSESPVAMKAAMVLFECAVVWAILQLLARRDLPATRVLLYAWHPLPLWEFAGSGHLDAMAIALLMLAFVAAVRHSPVFAGIALASGVLIKFFPIIAGPALYRRWDWRLPVAFACTVLILYAPYIGVGTKVFGFLSQYFAEEGFDSGAGIYLWTLLGAIVSLPSGASVVYLPAVAAILIVLALVFLFRSRRGAGDLLAATVLIFTALMLISPHYPWYFCWLIPFLCFYPFAAGIYLTGAASFLHLSHWPPTLLEGTLIYGGSVAILAIELAYRRYQKETSSGNAVAG